MLRDEIIPFIDGQGYVSPNAVPVGTIRGCDNQCMFTSEYYVMLEKLHEDKPYDADEWESKILKCMLEPGLTVRSPGDRATDSPDNTLGILCGATVLDKPKIASNILDYGYKHWGWFNPENPGSIYKADGKTICWEAFLWRQPQLLAATAAAANRLTILHFPVVLYAALVILYTGLSNIDRWDTDSRRLAWLLVQIMSPASFICRLASKVWYWKLYKEYPNGMKDVCRVYYQEGHPFAKYWVD